MLDPLVADRRLDLRSDVPLRLEGRLFVSDACRASFSSSLVTRVLDSVDTVRWYFSFLERLFSFRELLLRDTSGLLLSNGFDGTPIFRTVSKSDWTLGKFASNVPRITLAVSDGGVGGASSN